MASTLRQRLPIDIDVSETVETISASSSDSGLDQDASLPPFTPPSYTQKDLFNAIPAHCWDRSALRSFSYVFADLIMIAANVYAASFIDPAFGFEGKTVLNGWAGVAAKWALWGVYWTTCGWNFVGIWILGTWPGSPCTPVS